MQQKRWRTYNIATYLNLIADMKEMRLWWSFMPITLTTLLATNFTSRGDFSFATHFEDSKKRPTVAIGRENQWAKRR
ncbi:hypothetical protein Bca52824_059588 [Brassica carinata]|uniref:Uncharacterized protein n=1 Tax=Brassica carinata TaxID=52824 RepID=A0A8X7QWT6_BRACI|nr:hypothetical protein Bca52824_059588 [Brassica carinata]